MTQRDALTMQTRKGKAQQQPRSFSLACLPVSTLPDLSTVGLPATIF